MAERFRRTRTVMGYERKTLEEASQARRCAVDAAGSSNSEKPPRQPPSPVLRACFGKAGATADRPSERNSRRVRSPYVCAVSPTSLSNPTLPLPGPSAKNTTPPLPPIVSPKFPFVGRAEGSRASGEDTGIVCLRGGLGVRL
jgi:hypothetical protein